VTYEAAGRAECPDLAVEDGRYAWLLHVSRHGTHLESVVLTAPTAKRLVALGGRQRLLGVGVTTTVAGSTYQLVVLKDDDPEPVRVDASECEADGLVVVLHRLRHRGRVSLPPDEVS
jgi:hypothetical protein